MNAIPYDRPEEEWDSYEDEQELALPGRPRRQWLTWWSAGLFALILCAAGFYAGVRIEKNQLANSSSAGAGAASRAGTGRSGAGGLGGGGGGLRARFGGGSGAGATLGTVSSISGNALYITETSGNTVNAALSSATKLTKSIAVGKNAVRPGDLVTVSGAKESGGALSATTVNDTGVSPFAAASGSSGGSSSVGGGSSAVNSLFGGG